ncbi:MAG: metal ABC transporter permease, partial [Planctomycetales bacterium]|nr:metal ABC transporter permease [Planctomycetales bacterium]
PVAAVVCAVVLVLNVLFVLILFKELRISTFDPQMATAQGIPAWWLQYAVMGLTALTLVAAFESVGSILVIAMLIVPAATASLLTDRLGVLLTISLIVAAAAATGGHVAAITVPSILFSRLGYPMVQDASTSGMMAVVAGLLFVATLLVAPRYGILGRMLSRWRLGVRIVREDLLGFVFRAEEGGLRGVSTPDIQATFPRSTFRLRLALRQLERGGLVRQSPIGIALTDSGRSEARELVRSHRLWESYMALHFQVPDDHLHSTAERVEHYIDGEFRRELAYELDQPAVDPHGQSIPVESPKADPESNAEGAQKQQGPE